jgi:PadR family transcriptional regulator, regulatory protein PadR
VIDPRLTGVRSLGAPVQEAALAREHRRAPPQLPAADALTFDNKRVLSNVEVSPNVPANPMAPRTDLLQGTLDLLILKTLLLGSLHGWGISKRLRQLSGDVLEIGQGSLYPALYRLEDRGWVTAEWRTSDEGRRAKFYSLTAAGRKRLGVERAQWQRFSAAVDDVLEAT